MKIRVLLRLSVVWILAFSFVACGGDGGGGGKDDGQGGAGGADAGTGGTGGEETGTGGTGGEGTGGTGGGTPNLGELRVEIDGLPPGTEARVTVRGPAGYESTLTESDTLQLEAGRYEVEAEEVEADAVIRIPSIAGSPAEVAPGETATVEVRYADLPFSLQAAPLTLPLTAALPLEVEVLRRGDFTGEVTVALVEPLPAGIEAERLDQVVGPVESRATFSLLAGEGVETLDGPLPLTLRASSELGELELTMELQVTALVTSAEGAGPGSLPEVLRAALASETFKPKVRFSPEAFSTPTTIRLGSELVIDDSVDLEGLLRGDEHLVALAAQGPTRLVRVESGDVRLASLLLRDGSSDGDGGCIHNSSLLQLEDVMIASCSATRGGGLYSAGSLTVRGGSFRANVAEEKGGAVFSADAAELADVELSSNRAKWGGGLAAEAERPRQVQLLRGLFWHNDAEFGGGLWAKGRATGSVTETRFEGNEASVNGGGAMLEASETWTFTGAHFVGNEALGGGAVTLSSGAQASIVGGTTLELNTANLGGAVFNHGTLTMNGAALVGNQATVAQGGAIFNFGTAKLTGGRLEGNSAETDGGAIDSVGPLAIETSLFRDNVSTTTAGAIITSKPLTVEASSFVTNQATTAGAIAAFNDLDIVNSTFAGNMADAHTGGLYLGGAAATVRIAFSTIAGNTGGVEIAASGASLFAVGTIFAQNGVDLRRTQGGFTSWGYNLIGIADPTIGGAIQLTDQAGTDASPLSPGLANLGENGGSTPTYLPLAGSPAREAVPVATCYGPGGAPLTVDQRGEPRPQGLCEIGAVELP